MSKRLRLGGAPNLGGQDRNPRPRRAVSAKALAALLEQLEVVAGNALCGDPPGPLLASRLQRECTHFLHSNGLTGARVQATSTREQTSVVVLLPTPDQRVERVVLRLA